MPLDPQLQTFLDQIKLIDPPPGSTQTPDEIRAAFAAVGTLSPRRSGVTVEEREIPGPAGTVPARVYTPQGATAPLGGLVYFHGGGHVFGSVADYDGPASILAASGGFGVVSVDYRLAPEHPFPADVEDADAVVEWVAAHAADLGIDAARLAVGGDSAGGNLAAVAARHARDAGLELAAQLLIYSWVDLDCDRPSMAENATGYFLRRDDLEHWRSLYVADEATWRHPDASALHADDLDGLAPAVVVTAGFDPLRDQGDAYAAKLRSAGVPVCHLPSPDMIHAFIQLTTLSEGAARDTERIARELAALLHP